MQLSMAEFSGAQFNSNNEGNSYNSPTSGSTITQLRDEYEDTIRLLNDEKRELVMKNSATISDLQRMEQRSWQLEEEIFRLKEELTSAHLKIQRLMNYNDKQTFSSSSAGLERMAKVAQDNTSKGALHRLEGNVDTPVNEYSYPTFTITAEGNEENINTTQSFHPWAQNKMKPPSLAESTQPRAGNAVNELPECKQS